MNENTRNNATNLIKGFEGFRAEPYLDGGGVWTIGYGTTYYPNGKKVARGDGPIDEKTAIIYLCFSLNALAEQLDKSIKVKTNDFQLAALLAFCYNVGVSAFKKSTMLKLLNAGDYEAAAKEFDKWVKDNGKVITGLVNRRRAERALFEAK